MANRFELNVQLDIIDTPDALADTLRLVAEEIAASSEMPDGAGTVESPDENAEPVGFWEVV